MPQRELTRKPRLWLQVVPLRAPVTAFHQWIKRMHDWEKSAAGRRFIEALNCGDWPHHPDYHNVYGYGKQEAAIDWVRGELMCGRIDKPIVWHLGAQRVLWWRTAFQHDYKCVAFFAGTPLQKTINRCGRFARSPKFRQGAAHVQLLTSPAAFHVKFNRVYEVVFVDYPLRPDMVRQAIDMTLRHNPHRNIHVYFLCMEGTLDERVARLMRNAVSNLYRFDEKPVAFSETSASITNEPTTEAVDVGESDLRVRLGTGGHSVPVDQDFGDDPNRAAIEPAWPGGGEPSGSGPG